MSAFCFPSDVDPAQTLVEVHASYLDLIRHFEALTGSTKVYLDARRFMEVGDLGHPDFISFNLDGRYYDTRLGAFYPGGRFAIFGNHLRGDWQRENITTLMPWLNYGWHNGAVIWYPRGFWGSGWPHEGPTPPRHTTCLPMGMTGIPDRLLRERGIVPTFGVKRNDDGYAEFYADPTVNPHERWNVGPRRSTARLAESSDDMYLGNLVNDDAAARFATFLEVKDVHHLAPLYSEDAAMAAAQQ